MGSTRIEWADKTWPVVTGCSPVSVGCQNCYAAAMADRLAGMVRADRKAGRNPGRKEWYEGLTKDGRWTGEVHTHDVALDDPLYWGKPCRVSVASMGDLFHEKVSDEFILKVWGVMTRVATRRFMVLTKRPARMAAAVEAVCTRLPRMLPGTAFPWPLPNVWLGVTAENQAMWDERVPVLAETPAAKRFVSAEPLLEPVDISSQVWPNACGCTEPHIAVNPDDCPHCKGTMAVTTIDQIIIGCESGPKRRPMELDWARDLIRQCRVAGVAVFVKQLEAERCPECFMSYPRGTRNEHETCPDCGVGKLVRRVSRDMDEWPEDLRIREEGPDGQAT